MASQSDNPPAAVIPSPGRLWAEQLAMGMGFLIAILVFMAFKHPATLSEGGQVLTTGDLAAYGWASVLGVLVHFIVHEGATLLVAKRCGLPLRFRFFPFGVNAAAILSAQPRRVWIDAVVGLAGPLTGAIFSLVLALIYQCTANPYFLGMASVGCFYNLFTLIPILELEGGWIAPALAPQALFLTMLASVFELAHGFNLALLGVVAFGLPRMILILRARAPREDLACTARQRLIVGVLYLALVLGLAWFGTSTFESLSRLVPEAMGD